MSKKELLELLASMTEEEISQLLASKKDEPEEEEETHTHTINKNNRRGSGFRKKNKEIASKRKKKKKKNKGNSSKGCRVLPMNVDHERQNKFNDFMESTNLDATEQAEIAEAAKSDKKVRKTAKKTRNKKRRSTLVDVECRICGQEDEVSASLIADPQRYKCNGCSTGAN